MRSSRESSIGESQTGPPTSTTPTERRRSWPSRRAHKIEAQSRWRLKGLVTEEAARTNARNPADTTFGLCEPVVVEVGELTGGVVSFWARPGQAHVSMYGCDDKRVATFVVGLARVIRPPGP